MGESMVHGSRTCDRFAGTAGGPAESPVPHLTDGRYTGATTHMTPAMRSTCRQAQETLEELLEASEHGVFLRCVIA